MLVKGTPVDLWPLHYHVHKTHKIWFLTPKSVGFQRVAYRICMLNLKLKFKIKQSCAPATIPSTLKFQKKLSSIYRRPERHTDRKRKSSISHTPINLIGQGFQYWHFLLVIYTKMVKVVEILPHGWQGPILCADPGHQHAWYWLCSPGILWLQHKQGNYFMKRQYKCISMYHYNSHSSTGVVI